MLKLVAALFAGVLLAIVVSAAPVGVAGCHAAAQATSPDAAASLPNLPALPDQAPSEHSPAERTAPGLGLGSCGLCGIKLPDEPPATLAERLAARIDAGSERDPGALPVRPPTPPPRG
ncbi:hypothetical protein [Blastochloris sulfoviridis]|uniref:DUF2946 domain-containing protein n=1 Tax=Blastochloris sulfoviridis TaxID=50712 RepID=A0A5M6I3G2_9HYPH|nr:hypothetical protein [Blastochloris sulfoviridis]KAA5602702.1 hypothetical protein F1193_04255 [Blastochloris sulfoviridis]